MAKETEITVQVYDELDEIDCKLQNINFSLKNQFTMIDCYFSKFTKEDLLKMSYSQIIKNSFLIRNMKGKSTILFKDKTIDKNNHVVSEEKICLNIDSCDKAKEVFSICGLNNWCNLVQNVYIYTNAEMELAVQVVHGLGTFIEYEEDELMKNLEIDEKINEMIRKVKNLNLNIGSDFFVKKVYLKFIQDNSVE